VNVDTDPPLDPFAEHLAVRLDQLAENAGQVDAGEETDDAHRDDELDQLATAVVAQLRQESTWTGPPPGLRAAVLARALAADAPTDARPEPPAPSAVPAAEPDADLPPLRTEIAEEPETAPRAPGLPPRWRRLRYAVPLAAAAAILFTVGVVAVDRSIRSDTPVGQHYTATGPLLQGQRPRIDLIVATTGAAGFAVTIQPHDLPGAGEGLYYAAWLHKPGSNDAYVPLGSFHARQAASIRLWSGVSPRDYPEFVITLQRVGQPPTPSDQVVVTARLD
jgi:Anti-sigma-K factor rskA